MEPTLRPAVPDAPSAPCPPGHVAEPAGVWAGRHMEVVFDPTRHDVMFVRGAKIDRFAEQLRATGFRPVGNDGASELWVRDRAEAARQALDRSARRSQARQPLGLA